MKHAFYVTTYQSGGEVQGDTKEDIGTERHTDLIGHIGRPMGISNTHTVGLVFNFF